MGFRGSVVVQRKASIFDLAVEDEVAEVSTESYLADDAPACGSFSCSIVRWRFAWSVSV